MTDYGRLIEDYLPIRAISLVHGDCRARNTASGGGK